MNKLRKARPSKTKTIGKGNRFNDIDLILRSAKKCFEQYGVEKTRLADIAKTAGVSRPLLYKLFDDRQALTDAVINFELQHLVEQQQLYMKNKRTFKAILIDGMIAGIELARKDKILMDLLTHSSIDHLPDLLLDNTQPAHDIVLSLWQKHFDKARESGELKSEVSDDDLMEWLMSVQYLFLMREEVGEKRIRTFLEAFVCSGIIAES